MADWIDSLGKIPSGFSLANLEWGGSFEQCEEIQVNREDG